VENRRKKSLRAQKVLLQKQRCHRELAIGGGVVNDLFASFSTNRAVVELPILRTGSSHREPWLAVLTKLGRRVRTNLDPSIYSSENQTRRQDALGRA
jgi:hypothetical protein